MQRSGLRPWAVVALLSVAAPIGGGSTTVGAPALTVEEFSQRMLKIYASAKDAFSSLDASPDNLDAAMDAKPLSLEEFVRGTRTFDPPLTGDQAKAMFSSLDANDDGLVNEDEFLDGLLGRGAVADGSASGTDLSAAAAASGGASAEPQQSQLPQPVRAEGYMSLTEFRSRVLEAYTSLTDAFAELDASAKGLDAALDEEPLDLEEFTVGTAAFKRPLTKVQAAFVFAGLDGDTDGLLSSDEFVGGVASGELVRTSTRTTTTLLTTLAALPTSTTTTLTQTATSTTTSTTLLGAPRWNEDVFELSELQRRMEPSYSPDAAYKAMDQSPVTVKAFARFAMGLKPPLSEREARYCFRGLDTDGDLLLVPEEFSQVLELGHFFPTSQEVHSMFSAWTTDKASVRSSSDAAVPGRDNVNGSVLFSLSCTLLIGYFARTVFLALRLPGVCGVMLCGLVLAGDLPSGLMGAREHVQEFLFFVMMFTTGFEVSVEGLSPTVLLLAVLPASAEFVGLFVFGVKVLGFGTLEAAALGAVLFTVGDGLLVPKLHGLGGRAVGNPLPRLLRLAAPVETCLGSGLFAVLLGLSGPLGGRPSGGGAALCVLRLAGSLALGAALGYASGKLMLVPSWARQSKGRFPLGTSVDSTLLLVAAALLSIGAASPGFTAGAAEMRPLLQPEMLVLASGLALAAGLGPELRRETGAAVASLAGVSQLLLFWLLGSSTGFGELWEYLPKTLAFMGVGLSARFVGVALASCLTARSRPCTASLWQDIVFSCLAALPRGSLQGTLGAGAVLSRLLLAGGDADAAGLIQAVVALYVLVLSSVGCLLLDCLGPGLLSPGASTASGSPSQAQLAEERHAAVGWTPCGGASGSSEPLGDLLRFGVVSEDGVVFEDADTPLFPSREAVKTLAKLYNVDPEVFLDAFQEQTGEGVRTLDELRSGSTYTRLQAESFEAARPGQTLIRRLVQPRTLPSAALFEASRDEAPVPPRPALDAAASAMAAATGSPGGSEGGGRTGQRAVRL